MISVDCFEALKKSKKYQTMLYNQWSKKYERENELFLNDSVKVNKINLYLIQLQAKCSPKCSSNKYKCLL